MKVCLVVSDFSPKVGGIATFNTDLSAALTRHEAIEEVRVIVLQGNETGEENFPKLSVRRFPRRSVVQIFFTLMRELWRSRGYDVVHSPNVFPVGFFTLVIAKYFLRIPTVITFHGTDVLAREGSVATRWAKKFTIFHASAATTVSRAVQRAVALRLTAPSERFSVIYYALPPKNLPAVAEDTRARHGIAADDIVVLSLGNLVRRKGVDDIIRAVARAHNPHLRLLIAGDGPQKQELERLVGELSLEARVRFLGRVPDARPLFAAADIFVLASRYIEEEGDIEGLGIVLLEAQRAGLPVVASRSGGIPEALLDGETGFTIDERDTVALTEKLDQLAKNPELRAKMGESGRAFVAERFNQGRIAEEYVSLYAKLIR